MILTTTNEIPGKKIKKILGIVRGSTVRSKHIGKDIMAGLKTIVGGEVKSYTEMLVEAREEALNRLIEHAKALGADAVVGVRFSSSQIMQGMSEMLAYGTAVKLSK